VFRNFQKATDLNKKIFEPDYLSRTHGQESVDVLNQDPEVKTFHRTPHIRNQQKLQTYINYQKKEKVKDESGRISFAVNIDIGNWEAHINELVSKIPDEFLFCSRMDTLQYVRRHILGMSQPQLYIKVKGAWTGGHEENLRFRAANLNHGPAPSEWNAVGSKDSSRLRNEVRDIYDVDIYKKEGLWFSDTDFCLAKKIPVV
jgi:hypothetical protein